MNIYQRLNKVREAVAYLQKDKLVANMYKAVTHDAVTAAVRPEFIKTGIIVVPRVVTSAMVPTGTTTGKGIPISRYEGRFSIRFVNMDEPADYVEIELDAHAMDEGDKAPGKAASYATKYAMLKLLSIETGEDEESRSEQAAGYAEIEKAVQAIMDAHTGAELKKHYAAGVALFDGNKAALLRLDKAKDAKLALAKAKKDDGNGTARV